jgi:hypothetical protein
MPRPEERLTATLALEEFADLFHVPTGAEVGEVPALPEGAFFVLPADYETAAAAAATVASSSAAGAGGSAGGGAAGGR